MIDGVTDDVVGGYRLVRVLGEGSRAVVWLGHPTASTGRSTPVAVKIYGPHVDFASMEREIAALSEVAGPHIVGVRDLAVGHDGRPVLVLERLAGHTLAGLLAERAHLAIGEAITILVPIAEVVARLSVAGVSHGHIVASSVFFSAEGAPVLACFGAAVTTGASSIAQREDEAALAEDLRALRDLATVVLGSVPVSPGMATFLAWAEASVLTPDWIEEFRARLFALGPAEPVARASVQASESTELRAAMLPARPRNRPTSVLSPVLEALDRLPPVLARVREWVAPVRARFWVAGAAALALLVASLVLVPHGSSDATPDMPTEVSSPTPAVLESDDDVSDDDPTVALEALLEARAECIRSVSVLCLDDVDQAGSAALTADQQLIRSIQTGSSMPADSSAPLLEGPWEFVIDEQLGGAALVSVSVSVSRPDSTPASILMIRSEAGWRIRDYLE